MSIQGKSYLQEFHELRDRAVKIVRQGGYPGHDRYHKQTFLFQFIEMPSLSGSTIGWQVYRRQHRDPGSPILYIGVRMEWCHDVDAEKFRTPVERLKYPLSGLEPTVHRRVLNLDTVLIERFWSDIPRFAPPITAGRASIVIDGIGYEFTVGDSYDGLTLRWWCDGPSEWQPLIKR